MNKFEYSLAIIFFILITSVNAFIYYKYRGCKFDKPYLIVLFAYNVSYLLEFIIAILYFSGVEDKFNKTDYNSQFDGFINLISNIGTAIIYATLILFANEMHRVKNLVLADNPK